MKRFILPAFFAQRLRIRLLQASLIFSLLLLARPLPADTAPPEPTRWRTLDVLLLKPDGTPAVGVDVHLRGLERDSFGLDTIFRSDTAGRFTVNFAELSAAQLQQRGETNAPGWGVFHLVAETLHDGRAVSPQLINDPPGEHRYDDPFSAANEWGSYRLPAAHAHFTLRLRQGITLSGRVIDTAGHPLQGIGISVGHDLHIFSHTGYGGEIFQTATTTDEKGRFTFTGLYPARFDLWVSPSTSARFWVRTKVRDHWAEEIIDEIIPRKHESEITVTVILSPQKLYRYFGRVTDSKEKPIANALVTAGVSRHRLVRTWGDNHHYEDTTTTEDGRFELMTETPFVRGFSVQAPGFQRADRWCEDDSGKTFAPGKYRFTLKPGKKTD